jgi:prepilin-type N-terminal cleavage/methylation domain-containing protein
MKRFKAFTLMELLVAVSIFSIIILCLYSTFSGGIGVWKRQEQAFQYAHSVRLALDTIAKELRHAINYSQPETGVSGFAQAGQDLKFTGDEKTLTFITISGEEIARIDYLFEKDQDQKGVLKKGIVLQKEGFKNDNRKEHILIENLDGLSFEYAYQGEKADSPVTWQKSWGKEAGETKAAIPIGVRIILEFQEPGQKEKEIFKKTVFIPSGNLGEPKGL